MEGLVNMIMYQKINVFCFFLDDRFQVKFDMPLSKQTKLIQLKSFGNNDFNCINFVSFKLRLKIDLVSYPARAEGLVNMIMYQKINVFCFFLDDRFQVRFDMPLSKETKLIQLKSLVPNLIMQKAQKDNQNNNRISYILT